MLVAMLNPANAIMGLPHSNYVRFSLLALSSIFFLVDPFAAIPTFIAITAGADARRRRRMALRGSLTCFIMLTSFAIAGQTIFKMFGIKLPAFEIAGGLILLLIGIDMLEAKRSPTQEIFRRSGRGRGERGCGHCAAGDSDAGRAGRDFERDGAGGAGAEAWEMAAILGSIALSATASYFVLNGADQVRKLLGETGIRILVRIMGLLLMALAVQFFVNGLTDLGVIARAGWPARAEGTRTLGNWLRAAGYARRGGLAFLPVDTESPTARLPPCEK